MQEILATELLVCRISATSDKKADTTDSKTTQKSKQFHESSKYPRGVSAVIFITISTKKIQLNNTPAEESPGRACFPLESSDAKKTQLTKMVLRMMFENILDLTIA